MKLLTSNSIVRTLILGFPFLSIFYTLYMLSSSNSVVDSRFFYGIGMYFITCMGSLQIETIFSFININTNKLSTLALGATLFLASFNLISFSHVEYGFSIKFSSLPSFGFNPVYVLIFILYLIAYKKELNEIFPKSQSSSTEQKEELFNNDVNHFIQKYESKSAIELKYIVDNSNLYCESAVEASKRILETKAKTLD